ncbi:MAG: HD domain-containing protein [Bacteroidaceae bacterium]|nr:HD domain-containing protein [Bacteroides sp.]MBQ4590163.1 HD domain-containing protein [Bacteroidaceae bacterium]
MKHYIETEIIPRYEAFDKAHRTDHVRQVIAESLQLASYYEVDERMVYTIAACHDIGLCEGREHHHLVSGRLMRADERLREWFTEEEIEIMAQAVEDHRASLDHAPRSIYGRIVAEADRLIEPMQILRRTVQYGLSHYPELTKEQHYLRYCEHLQEKYAEGGYLKLWIPESENASQLKALRGIIADETRKREVFERIFEEEFTFP